MSEDFEHQAAAFSERTRCGQVNRRTLLHMAAMLTTGTASAAVLAACASSTSGSASTSTTSTSASATSSVASSSTATSSTTASPTQSSTVSSSVTSSVSSSVSVSSTASQAAVANPNIPSYIPLTSVKPNLPGSAAGIPAGYLKLPAPYSAYSGVPGKGGKVSFFTIDYVPPAPPLSSNKFWQGLNKRLGVNLEVDLVPASGYQDKFAAMTASGDIPDTVVFLTWQPIPHLYELLDHEFVNLTPYLAGDKVKSYPNLANLDTYAWRNSMVNNQVWGVPISRSVAGNGLLFRDDWAAAMKLDFPKNADDFFNVMKEFTDPSKNRWGIAGVQNGAFNVGYFLQMYRGPNNWRLNPNKTLTNAIETPEYEEAVAYCVKLFKAGFYYPGSANLNILQAKQYFAAGRIGCYPDGITASPQMWLNFKTADPKSTFTLLPPFGYDGGKAAYALSNGLFSYTTVSKKNQSRIEEILDIFDYCAAPFGSEQWQYLNFGVKGWDWNPNKSGAPVLTKTGQSEQLPTGYICAPPYILYDSQYPEVTKMMHTFCDEAVPQGVNDPTIGLYSATAASKNASLTRLINDRVVSIVSGRSPISDLKTLISEWRSQGGDQMRKEYEQALAKQ